MRKRKLTRQIGVMLTEETYQTLISITDKLENTLSEYLRCLVEKELKENQKEEYRNE